MIDRESDLAKAQICSASRRRPCCRLEWANTQLQGKTFVVGEDFNVADGYLFTLLAWLRHLGIDLGQWAALRAEGLA